MGSVVTGPKLVVGGREFTDIENLIVLQGFVTGIARHSTLLKDGALYAAGGSGFKIEAFRFTQTGQTWFSLGYDEGAVIHKSVATITLTNEVFFGGHDANQGTYRVGAGDGIVTEYSTSLVVPTGKYPWVQIGSNVSAGMEVFGYEI